MKNAGRRGFTLVEVMAVIALIVLVAGFASRGGSSARQTITLEREANKLADTIRVARQNSYAISGAGGGFAPSHSVGFSTGGIQLYTVNASVADISETPNPNEIRTLLCASSGSDGYSLAGGITVESVTFNGGSADGARVVFVRPLPTTYIVSCGGGQPVRGAGELQVTLTNVNGNQRIVSVNSVGKVEVSTPPQP